jgi:hypothetical protein
MGVTIMAYIGPGITIEGGVTLTTLPQFYDASAGFDGWDLSTGGSGAPSLDAVTGNAAPSFKLTLSNQYMRRNLGTKFLNKTIQFDIKLGYTGTGSAGSGADTLFLFAQNTAGNSAYRGVLRMWQSNVGVTVTQGLTTTDNAGWLYAGLSAGGETSRLFAGETWYTVKIQITSGGVVTWYINNALQTSTITLPAGYATADENYNWFGIVSNNYGGTANYDNLYIWDGIV